VSIQPELPSLGVTPEHYQVRHVERLLERVRSMTGLGYTDDYLTVSVAEVMGALAEGQAEWDEETARGLVHDE
jgi:hypothetical protein